MTNSCGARARIQVGAGDPTTAQRGAQRGWVVAGSFGRRLPRAQQKVPVIGFLWDDLAVSMAPADRCIRAAAERARLDRRSHDHHRLSLDGGKAARSPHVGSTCDFSGKRHGRRVFIFKARVGRTAATASKQRKRRSLFAARQHLRALPADPIPDQRKKEKGPMSTAPRYPSKCFGPCSGPLERLTYRPMWPSFSRRPDGLALTKAFTRIKRREVRRGIVSLVGGNDER